MRVWLVGRIVSVSARFIGQSTLLASCEAKILINGPKSYTQHKFSKSFSVLTMPLRTSIIVSGDN